MSFLKPRSRAQAANADAPTATGRVSERRAGLREKHRDRQRTKPNPLDQGLELLNERLGKSAPGPSARAASRVHVETTGNLARSVYYSPDLDGPAEPGEVVWVTVPSDPPQERSMLVVGRNRQQVLGLLISSGDKAKGEDFVEIGNGEWHTATGRCWLRMDKTLSVPETDVHRRGVLFPRLRFEMVANRLRSRFHWA